MKKASYNPEIDIWKTVFTIAIFLFHSKKFETTTGWSLFLKGYLAVEFFFIVSGYFMAAKLRPSSGALPESRQVEREQTRYFLKHKIQSFYTYFLISFLVIFIARQFVLKVNFLTLIKNILLSPYEFLLLYMYGIPAGRNYNGPTWYLSAMIIAMAILHPILKKYFHYFSSVGAPMTALFCYALIAQEYKILNVAHDWFVITRNGTIRALAGLSLGIFCYDCCERIKMSRWQVTAAGKRLFGLIKFFIFGLIFCIMNFSSRLKLGASYDYVAVLLLFLFSVIIFSGLSGGNERFKNPERFKLLAPFNLLLYLNHRGTIYALNSLDVSWRYLHYMFYYIIGTGASMLCSLLLIRGWYRFKSTAGKKLWGKLFSPKFF